MEYNIYIVVAIICCIALALYAWKTYHRKSEYTALVDSINKRQRKTAGVAAETDS